MEIHGSAPELAQTPEQQGVAIEQTVKRKRSRKRNITIFIVVSLLNVALLALLWTQLLTPSKQAQTQGSVLSIGDTNFPLIGKPMVDFSLSTLNAPNTPARIVHLADFKGKPIMLNFWASWCEACQQEAPYLSKAVPQLEKQGVVFIGIDGQDSGKAAQQFLQQYQLSDLNVVDTLTGSTAISYGVTGFPETVFINKQGIVVGKWAGALDASSVKLEMAKTGM